MSQPRTRRYRCLPENGCNASYNRRTPIVSCSYLSLNSALVKYLGLLTLKEVLEKGEQKLIEQYKPQVMQCFSSEDPSIKARALEIIKVTVSISLP